MKNRVLVLSLLVLMGIIFTGAPTLAQEGGDAWGGRWPWTSTRLIQPAELYPLSLGDLEIMRNEIYARHGWVFRRQDLRQYFEHQPWYRPSSENAFYSNRRVEAELSPVERRNLQIIISREHELGK
jgi:hypothetical protein